MGPEGGVNGGKIIAEGTPEKVSQKTDSFTGKFLKDLLGNSNMKKLLNHFYQGTIFSSFFSSVL